jgi:hypothetical protein
MAAKTVRFATELTRTGKTTTGIIVPPAAMAALGAGARPALVVRVNGYTYRPTVGVMGGKSMLPFSTQHREQSCIQGGDSIHVELTIDLAPREIEIPDDLEKAISVDQKVRSAFLKQAPSRQKADVDNVGGAKAPETRAKRIATIVARLGS